MENITIKTTGEHEVVMKPFMTGRQAEAVALVEGASDKVRNVAASHEILNALLVSVDGKTESMLEAVRDFNVLDYSEVVAKAVEISNGGKKEESTPKI